MSYFFWLGIDAERYETIPFATFDYVEADGFITIHPKL